MRDEPPLSHVRAPSLGGQGGEFVHGADTGVSIAECQSYATTSPHSQCLTKAETECSLIKCEKNALARDFDPMYRVVEEGEVRCLFVPTKFRK